MPSDRAQRYKLAAAGAAGTLARGLLQASRAVPGLAGAGLVAYGAWLAWPPAGFISAGALVLADVVATRVADRTKKGGEE